MNRSRSQGIRDGNSKAMFSGFFFAGWLSKRRAILNSQSSIYSIAIEVISLLWGVAVRAKLDA